MKIKKLSLGNRVRVIKQCRDRGEIGHIVTKDNNMFEVWFEKGGQNLFYFDDLKKIGKTQ